MRAGLILLQVCLVDDWGLWSMDPSVERVPNSRLWHGHLEPVLLAMEDYTIFKANASPWTLAWQWKMFMWKSFSNVQVFLWLVKSDCLTCVILPSFLVVVRAGKCREKWHDGRRKMRQRKGSDAIDDTGGKKTSAHSLLWLVNWYVEGLIKGQLYFGNEILSVLSN